MSQQSEHESATPLIGGTHVVVIPTHRWFRQAEQTAFGMTDPDEERQKIERDMWRVVWVLLPIAAFIFLLLVIQRFGLSQ